MNDNQLLSEPNPGLSWGGQFRAGLRWLMPQEELSQRCLILALFLLLVCSTWGLIIGSTSLAVDSLGLAAL